MSSKSNWKNIYEYFFISKGVWLPLLCRCSAAALPLLFRCSAVAPAPACFPLYLPCWSLYYFCDFERSSTNKLYYLLIGLRAKLQEIPMIFIGKSIFSDKLILPKKGKPLNQYIKNNRNKTPKIFIFLVWQNYKPFSIY